MQVKRKSVASTAVLAGLLLSLLNAIPAQAAPAVALTVNGVAITTATSSSTPASVSVPFDNSVDAPEAVRFSLTGIDTGSTVTVSATNAFIVSTLSTTLNPIKSNSGVASASYSVGTGTTSEFYAYTKSTALGTIIITNAGSTFTYYLKGIAGPAYTISYTAPATPYTSTISKQSAVISDIFGNKVVGVTPALALINLTSTTPTATSAEGVSEFTITYPSVPGQSALSISITATDVVGLPAAVKAITAFINVADPASALAAEKAAHAVEKAAADAALAAEKAARASDKVAADAALAAEKAARAADKATTDRSIATLTAQIASLKVLYNKLATKFKQKKIN
ncbi:unannotated protein [freshwater metagenome]|uniref:Unannotated protein n=1 Tax=freshwater metagenome TaxID=449393 RepID=A0A6J7VXU1_9ZZZZ